MRGAAYRSLEISQGHGTSMATAPHFPKSAGVQLEFT